MPFEVIAEPYEVQQARKFPGESMSMMLQRGHRRKEVITHVEMTLSREYPRVASLPAEQVADGASAVLMQALQESGEAHCSTSPLYTEDHKRHALEVSELFEKRRSIRAQYAEIEGSEDLEGEDVRLCLELRRVSKWLRNR